MDNPGGRGRNAVDDASSEEMTAQLRLRGYTIVTPAGTPRYGGVPEPSSGVRWVSTEARTKRHDDRARSSDERQREEDHHSAIAAYEERERIATEEVAEAVDTAVTSERAAEAACAQTEAAVNEVKEFRMMMEQAEVREGLARGALTEHGAPEMQELVRNFEANEQFLRAENTRVGGDARLAKTQHDQDMETMNAEMARGMGSPSARL